MDARRHVRPIPGSFDAAPATTLREGSRSTPRVRIREVPMDYLYIVQRCKETADPRVVGLYQAALEDDQVSDGCQ